jgi:hypothetical protein
MKKQPEFRILEIQKGGLTTYQAQVKRRWRWRSFYVNYQGNVVFWYSPSRFHSGEQKYIEEYKLVKGLL